MRRPRPRSWQTALAAGAASSAIMLGFEGCSKDAAKAEKAIAAD
jgi:hypothetical protein